MTDDCPVCAGSERDALWWSKAGMTSKLCDAHREAARSTRRLQYEFKRIRRLTFRGVRMDER